MGDKTAIEWTDATWNPIRARNKKTGKVGWHCVHVTEACKHCYAESRNKWIGTGLPFKPGHLPKDIELFLDEDMLAKPLRWKRPRMIFVCSMTDLFGEFVPDEWIDRMFAVMALCPRHTFQVLTKRPERMRAYMEALASTPVEFEPTLLNAIARAESGPCHRLFQAAQQLNWFVDAPGDGCFLPNRWPGWPLPNVWLGTSVEDQATADQRIPDLLATPAAIRFVSYEPALGPVDFTRICLLPRKPGSARAGIHVDALSGRYCESGLSYIGEWAIAGPYPQGAPALRLDWIIAGGESGPKARAAHPDWFRSVRDQCEAAGVAFLFKQHGEWLSWSQFTATEIEDDPEQTRFKTMEWRNGAWHDVGYPMWCDTADGYIDDEQCVGRVGKKRAGRLLDGRTHDAFPTLISGAVERVEHASPEAIKRKGDFPCQQFGN